MNISLSLILSVVLRFAVCSDSHVQAPDDIYCQRLQKVLEMSYAAASADATHPSVDLFLEVGDLTNHGKKDEFEAYRKAIQGAIRPETQFLAVIPKGHDGIPGKDVLRYFSELMMGGGSMDFHRKIGGYHFIGISTSVEEGVYYSPYQREWLVKQLDEAVADDPGKPVFVCHHEHPKFTVYGSSQVDGWGHSYFIDIFSRYPQIVHFSGHSHYPINDPRSVCQKDYTAIGTGSLAYMEFTVGAERKIHPDGYGDEAQFWLVEVNDDESIMLRGYDVVEGTLLCQYLVWADRDRFEYSPEQQAARSKAPVFDSRAVMSLRSGTLSFSPAMSGDGMPVFLYRVNVRDDAGKTVYDGWRLPKYYSATPESVITVPVGGLGEGRFTVSVTAETAYGVRSMPLVRRIRNRK